MNKRNRKAVANTIWWFLAGPAVPASIMGLVESLNIGDHQFLGPTHLVLIMGCVFWGVSWFGIFFYWMRRFVDGNDEGSEPSVADRSEK